MNLTVSEGLQLLGDGSPINSDGRHPLSVVGRDACNQEDNVVADNSGSLCLAREILHELEEDLVESPKPPSSDNVPQAECGDQQTAAAECTRHQLSSDDATVPEESSDSPLCSNNLETSTSNSEESECKLVGDEKLHSNTLSRTVTAVSYTHLTLPTKRIV